MRKKSNKSYRGTFYKVLPNTVNKYRDTIKIYKMPLSGGIKKNDNRMSCGFYIVLDQKKYIKKTMEFESSL